MTSSTEAHRLLRGGLALCIVLLFAACASTPPASEEERAAYQAAIAELSEDRDEGVEALEEFVGRWPDSPLADDAAIQLARLATEDGDRDAALRHLYLVIERHGDGDLAPMARVRAARLEFAGGEPDKARALLEGLETKRLQPADRRLAYRLRADLSRDPAAKLRWLVALREMAERNSETSRNLSLELAALLKRVPSEDLERASESMGRSASAGLIHMELAERAMAAGDYELAGDALSGASRARMDDSDRRRLERLLEQFSMAELVADRSDLPTFAEAMKGGWKLPEDVSGTLGVILPLSGPFAPYGEASLRGILLAAGIFEASGDPNAPLPVVLPDAESLPPVDAPPVDGATRPVELEPEPEPKKPARTGLRIVVRDSAGDPVRAAAAARELAADDEVVAILGPFRSDASEAAAVVSEEEQIPILTLSSKQEISRERSNAFRLGTTPDDELRYLLNYADEELGAKRFAVMYPEDTYGLGMRERFWEGVRARGGTVVAMSSYDRSAVDFAEPIREMIGYTLLTNAEHRALARRHKLLERGRRLEPEVAAVVRDVAYSILGPEGEDLPPRVDFDALFIPDSYKKVVLIAPQLAFHELDHVQLLGSSGWNHPDLVRIARKHVRGAVIATSFHLDSPFPFVEEFVDGYVATFQLQPDSYSAHAYDAARLVLFQLAAGRDTREAVRDGVLEVSGFPGVSGVFTLLPDGNARKRPFLLRVRGGRLIPVDSLN